MKRLRRARAQPFGISSSNLLRNGLSVRQKQILLLVSEGHRNRDIAKKLGLSVNTVCTHMKHIFNKLHVSSRTEAAVRYVEFKVARQALHRMFRPT